MQVYNPLNCSKVSPQEFGDLTDLMLVSATAYATIPFYPVDFGRPPSVTIEVDKEFSVLTDWLGRVLTQGFVTEE